MSTLVTILHVIVCLFLMLTVLLQSGKGGGMGGAFGGGNAATVFGGSGASTFLKKLTAGAGTIFMITSMVLAFLASHNSADALEKFGEQQEKIASEKEAAKKKVLESGTGSAAGSGAAVGSGSAATSSSSSEGSAAPAAGSDAIVAPGAAANGSNGGASGNAVTPSENPTTATKPGEKPNPGTPSSMSPAEKPGAEKPAPAAEKPAAPAAEKPAAEKPAAPAAGSAEVKLNDPKDLKPTDSPKPADTSPNAPK